MRSCSWNKCGFKRQEERQPPRRKASYDICQMCSGRYKEAFCCCGCFGFLAFPQFSVLLRDTGVITLDLPVSEKLSAGEKRKFAEEPKLETGIPDAGNHLNSAQVICSWTGFICQALAASAVRSRLYKRRLFRQTTKRRIEMITKRFPVIGQVM